MRIKTLTIQGFKSYKGQTAVDEFHPRHNVVVGKNGSGKSNFFAAVRFVLSDGYNSMSREDRQALLHDSSTSDVTTLSAYVEITFDNKDRRFPHGSGEDVKLRRTVGLKKDEYSLDGKSITKQEVLGLLEGAGFSQANPYYIVPQGRITHLTNMKDVDRLNLLKDVAGTKVYETRRAESLRIMEETTVKKKSIEDLLNYINTRLQELEEEQKELKEFQEKDKERRCLEYALCFKEQQDIIGKQEDLELKQGENTSKVNEATRRFNDREDVLKRLDESLTSLKQKAAVLIAERDALVLERRELARTQASLESSLHDQEERGERSRGSKSELQRRASELDAQISETEGSLMSLIPTLEDQTRELAQARAAFDETKAKVDVLFAKQARSTQFSTQAQRDSALREQLQSMEAFEAGQESRKADIEAEMEQIRSKVASLETNISRKNEQLQERLSFVKQRAQEWDSLKQQDEKLQEKKKLLWREESKLTSSTRVAEEQLANARKALTSTMDRATASGLASVERIAERLGLSGVHGPMYKLFKVNDTYKYAVEVTAGQSLFHIVVDNDETASKLLEVMNKEKSGRVTFVPLNRIKPKFSSLDTTEAIPMIKKIEFDQRFTLAMQQVFGRTVICPSMTVAASISREHGINAITLDGDRAERKGALTGGYHDKKRSRLDAASNASRWQEVFDADSARLHEIRQELGDLEQSITAIASQRQQLESRSKQIMSSRQVIVDELHMLREQESDCQKRLNRMQTQIDQTASELNSCALKKSALQAELHTPLRRGLASAEEADLKSLTALMDTQEKEVAHLATAVSKLANERQLLEIDLYNNLRRDREAVAGQLELLEQGSPMDSQEATEAASAVKPETIAGHKRQLTRIRKLLSDGQKSVDRLEKEVEEHQAKMREAEEQLAETTREQADEARLIERHDKIMIKYLGRLRELAHQREDAERKVRELGIVPGEAYNKYIGSSSESIAKALHRLHSALKKYSSVNRRAVEQYDSFTRQRADLIARQEELESAEESIEELISTLDMRKDEAIERTFKQVSRNFGEVFEKLVPMGRGTLIMQRRADATGIDEGEDEQMDTDEPKQARSSIENYTGVAIKVSFHSKVDEGLRIQQLSGGQKSLVALAIVFAIQKCDPAPFYLFDEIDANLDAQYRTAVASMIQELGENAQFITTTFRPELVGVGDKHYGVTFSAEKVSYLNVITQEEALGFVEASSQTG